MRFKLGELAIVAVDAGGNGHEGLMVEIVEVGPMLIITQRVVNGMPERVVMDYQVNIEGEHPLDGKWFVWDWELRKIDPPAEPAEMTETEEQEMNA